MSLREAFNTVRINDGWAERRRRNRRTRLLLDHGCRAVDRRSAGKTGEIAMVGFDLLPTTAEFIRTPASSTFTISQNPEEQGYQAVKVLVRLPGRRVEI